MMPIKILHAYLTKRLLANLAISLALFTGLVLLLSLGKFSRLAQDKGFEFGVILRSIPYLLPYLLSITLPMSLAVAVVVTFGGLAEDNEFTAIKAAGVSPFWLICPVLVIGALATALTFYLSDTARSASMARLRAKILLSAKESLKKSAQPGRTLMLSLADGTGMTLCFLPEDDRSGELRRPVAAFREGPGADSFFAWDHRLEFTSTGDEQENADIRLVLELIDGEHIPGRLDRVLYFESGKKTFMVPSKLAARLGLGKTPATRSLAWNLRTHEEARKRLADHRRNLAGHMADQAAWSVIAADVGSTEALVHARDAAAHADHAARRIKADAELSTCGIVEFHRRLSTAFSALAFVLLGIPVGLRFGQGGPIRCGLLGVMIVALLFYPFLVALRGMAEVDRIHPGFLWTPTALIAVLGVVSLRRLFLHS